MRGKGGGRHDIAKQRLWQAMKRSGVNSRIVLGNTQLEFESVHC